MRFLQHLFSRLSNNYGFADNHGDEDDDDDLEDDIPADDKKVEDKDVVVIGDEDPDADTPAEGMTVDLTDDEEENDYGQKPKGDSSVIRKLRRQNKELKKKLATVRTAEPTQPVYPSGNTQGQAPAAQPASPNTGVPTTEAEWDALAEKDWKLAVDLRSQANARQVLEQQTTQTKAAKDLEEAKTRVLRRHPELNDGNSDKTKIFQQILNQHPEYASHPRGPVFAMRDMEEYMEDVLGYKPEQIVSAERRGAQKEIERQHRVILTQTSGKSDMAPSSSVTLTKDEVEFCKLQGLDPKEYARTKRRMETADKGGLQV